MHWFIDPIKNHYVDFEGRTARKAFWMFALIHFIFSLVINFIGEATNLEFLALIYGLVIFLPALAISVRRLHDVGMSGWWVLLSFIPILGFLVLLFFYVKPSDVGANKYGPNPYGNSSEETHLDDVPHPGGPATNDVPRPPTSTQDEVPKPPTSAS